MRGAVGEGDARAEDRVARQGAAGRGLAEALSRRRG